MSSQAMVAGEGKRWWNAAVALGGAAFWSGFAVLAGSHRAPFGIIELLLLFAPLVIVPLALDLERSLQVSLWSGVLSRSFAMLATLAACLAVWAPPGRIAALLSGLWWLECAVLAGSRFSSRRGKAISLASCILDLAHADLLIGASWMVISRAGWRPMSFQEPIIALTAVHFHYSGFAMAILAAATLEFLRQRGADRAALRALLSAVVLLPFALAAGFVFSPLLRLVAAIALSACVILLAGVWLGSVRTLRNRHARFFVAMAACAVMAGLALSCVYAFSEYFGMGWITVPGMANSHGIFNGLGFVLLGLLGWRIEFQEEDSQGENKRDPVGRVVNETRAWEDPLRLPRISPSSVPEFVAREFYDR